MFEFIWNRWVYRCRWRETHWRAQAASEQLKMHLVMYWSRRWRHLIRYPASKFFIVIVYFSQNETLTREKLWKRQGKLSFLISNNITMITHLFRCGIVLLFKIDKNESFLASFKFNAILGAYLGPKYIWYIPHLNLFVILSLFLV